jgi:hypothetical protein
MVPSLRWWRQTPEKGIGPSGEVFARDATYAARIRSASSGGRSVATSRPRSSSRV